jgi:hypothetical protein
VALRKNFEVIVNESAVKEFVDKADGPIAQDLRQRAEKATRSSIRRAPISKAGSHGRRRGYLRSQIRWRVGKDGKGLFVDIESPALNPHDGKPYGLFQEKRHPYLRPAIRSLR